MGRKKTEPKIPQTDATISPQPAEVIRWQRKTPPWHRQYLRRLALHGDKDRAARESKISVRQVYRVERSKPRFLKASRAAQRIALQAHSDRLNSKLLDLAENGYTVPIVSAGKVVSHAKRMLPSLTKLVAEITVPQFRDARDRRDTKKASRESVSNTVNNVSIGLTHALADDPVIRAALMQISERMTQSRESTVQAIDVSPPTGQAFDADSLVRSDDE